VGTLTLVSKKYGAFQIQLDDDNDHLLSDFVYHVMKRPYGGFDVCRNAKTDVPCKYKTWLLSWDVSGKPADGLVTDHIDRDPLNNRRENIRHVTQRLNTHNRATVGDVPGVSWNKARHKWVARISVGLCTRHLGIFADHRAAVAARRLAEATI
jgi:hypothetical protein